VLISAAHFEVLRAETCPPKTKKPTPDASVFL
jgi:hypothetical protein